MWHAEFVQYLEESTVEKPLVDEANALRQRNLPAKIYKYRGDTIHSRENLRTDTIWMASPETYNDPYDSWLTFPLDTLLTFLEAALVDNFVAAAKLDGVISAKEIEDAKKSPEPLRAVLKNLQVLRSASAVEFWGERAKTYSAQLVGYAKNAVSQIEGLRKREKVCSFSAISDSLLMWSHYADNHKGFCVEFDIESLSEQHFFRKNLYPVLYAREFYDLRSFMSRLANGPRGDFRPMVPLLAMLHKFDGWMYESEWRLMHETEIVVDDHNRAAPIPSRIFLGARFDPLIGKDLLAICQQKAIPTFQMYLADDEFALSLREFVQ
jgi:hypothetical protein